MKRPGIYMVQIHRDGMAGWIQYVVSRSATRASSKALKSFAQEQKRAGEASTGYVASKIERLGDVII